MTELITKASPVSRRGGGGPPIPPVVHRCPVSLQVGPDSPLDNDWGLDEGHKEQKQEVEDMWAPHPVTTWAAPIQLRLIMSCQCVAICEVWGVSSCRSDRSVLVLSCIVVPVQSMVITPGTCFVFLLAALTRYLTVLHIKLTASVFSWYPILAKIFSFNVNNRKNSTFNRRYFINVSTTENSFVHWSMIWHTTSRAQDHDRLFIGDYKFWDNILAALGPL